MRPDFSPAHSPLIPAVWAPVLAPLSRPPEDVAGGPAPPPSYTPALKFNDARNSQYVLLFPWLGITPTGAAVPATAITLGGDPLTLGGEYLTVG